MRCFANITKNQAQDNISKEVNNCQIDLLMLIGGGEVLSAWWSSVTRVRIVQCVLSEKTAVVLVYSSRSDSRSFCQFHPGSIFGFCLSFHRLRRPLQVSSHVSTNWSLCCGRLSLINWRWCLKKITIESFMNIIVVQLLPFSRNNYFKARCIMWRFDRIYDFFMEQFNIKTIEMGTKLYIQIHHRRFLCLH